MEVEIHLPSVVETEEMQSDAGLFPAYGTQHESEAVFPVVEDNPAEADAAAAVEDVVATVAEKLGEVVAAAADDVVS